VTYGSAPASDATQQFISASRGRRLTHISTLRVQSFILKLSRELDPPETLMTTATLRGHTALVTGGSRGIGAAIVRALAEAGAAVAVNYRERAGEAEARVKEIVGAGGRAIAVRADVAQPDAVTKLVQRVNAALGPIDILVNNAGVAIVRGVDDLTEQDFDRTIAVNLKSVFLCMQAVLPTMRARKWGRIVNISSGAARGAGSIGPHYNASKAGLEGLTRGYAARLVKEGITVNAVAPSLIETDMMKGQESLVSRIPLGRFGKAEEVAQAVVMLLGNPYMTGQTVALSGGMAFN
jgi:3-oxoacyl-[acyl-carrier protein] reductase